MSRPGTTLTRSETRPARSARTGTGPWFIVGVTGTADTLGPTGVRTSCKNLTDYATRFGSRATHVNDGTGGGPSGATTMYDVAEFFFKEGGAELFVSPATYNVTSTTMETNIAAALALFTKDLGPGQVSVPGRSTPATHLATAVHAEANNRVGILDGPDTAVTATLTAAATIAGITQNQERYVAMFAPWVTVPPTTSPGTNRTVPPSCIVAGLMARRDGEGWTQNQPAAGALGESDQGINTTRTYIDVDRTTLNANGINILRPMYDGVRVYGYRTLADPSTDSNWKNLANARLFMRIQALADEIMERYVFRQLDGQRLVINEFGGELTGMLLPFWERGSLYGLVPEQAFRVDVGPNVNTDATIANGELHAVVMLRMSEFAEEVIVELVKVRVTEAV
jgi:hypothetical protein